MDVITWIEFFKKLTENFDDMAVPMAAIFVGIMTILRLVAEVLAVIAEKTATKLDDKALGWLNTAIKACAKIAAYFGVGKPKRLN